MPIKSDLLKFLFVFQRFPLETRNSATSAKSIHLSKNTTGQRAAQQEETTESSLLKTICS